MKKLRMLSLLLACLMLLGSCTLLASCSKSGDGVKVSRKTQTVNLADYAVLHEDVFSTKPAYKEMMSDFATLVSTQSGKNKVAKSFSSTKTTAADPEILIGNTSRSQTQAALASIKGEGFTVQVIDNKLVIVGTSQLLTVQALNYFTENYLRPAQEETELMLPVSCTASSAKRIRSAFAFTAAALKISSTFSCE